MNKKKQVWIILNKILFYFWTLVQSKYIIIN